MATIKTRLEQARDLIKAKQYNEARAILRTLDNPTATQWLAKLDEIAPEMADPFVEMKQERRRKWLSCLLIAAALVCVLMIGSVIFYTQSIVPAMDRINTQIYGTIHAPATTYTAVSPRRK